MKMKAENAAEIAMLKIKAEICSIYNWTCTGYNWGNSKKADVS